MNLFIFCALLAYFPLTALLRLGGDGSLESDADRIIFADFFAMLLIVVAFFQCVAEGKLVFSRIHLWFLPLLGVFVLSALFAHHTERALVETVGTAWSFVVSIALVNLIVRLPKTYFHHFLQAYVIIMGLLSLLFLVEFLFFSGVIGRPIGGLTGTFRNTGQAGAFLGVQFAICLALLLSGFVRRTHLNYSLVMSIALALIFTFKRSAWVGLGVGLILLILWLLFSPSVRDKRLAIGFAAMTVMAALLGTFIFYWGLDLVPGMRSRWEAKFASLTAESVTEGFIADNVSAALSALSDSPLIGVGLGAANIAQDHLSGFHWEIHSTYLAVLAASGLFGALAYAAFMGNFFLAGRNMLQTARNTYGRFFYYLAPLLLGLMASWSYTYHIRKREFWILVTFVAVFYALSKRRSGVTLAEAEGDDGKSESDKAAA